MAEVGRGGVAEERETRLRFMRIDGQTSSRLREAWRMVEPHLDRIVEGFYSHVGAQPALADILAKGPGIPELKKAQRAHWQVLFSGTFDADYINRAKRIGDAHALIGLDPSWYIGGYAFFMQEVMKVLLGNRRNKASAELVSAVQTAVLLDMDLAISAYNTKGEVEKVRSQTLAVVDMLEREISVTVREVAFQATRMRDMASAMKDGANDLLEAVQNVRMASEHSASSVHSVAAATEELTASGAEIARQVGVSAKLTSDAALQGREAKDSVENLAKAAEHISGIVGLINDIAAQTKLLALNASIEAARAGEAGRGFTVVANEVKRLAGQTESALSDVNTQVGEVKSATSLATKSIGAISDTIENVDQIAGGVAAAIEEQDAATAEIGRSAGDASDATQTTDETIQRVADRAAQAESESRLLGDMAEVVAKNVDDMSRRLTIVVRASFAGNRRGEERLPTVVPTQMRLDGKHEKGFLGDVNLRGCMVVVDNPERFARQDEDGSRTCLLDLGGASEVTAYVMAITSVGIHCRFKNMSKEGEAQLRRLMVESKAENDKYAEICQKAAADASEKLDEAVRTGRISVEDMFDSDYRIIPDTNPHQYLTNFTSLTDKLLPAIQEPPVNRDSRIRLLCATDRNGYIATHNKQYSEPQRADDPVWNAAHSRNRRIFDDRAGLAAATNQQPVLIQTYVRDMGNQRVLLKEVDCPIKIADRHWGNMRLAFA